MTETHGEAVGHPFRGNQWTGGKGGLAPGDPQRDANFRTWFSGSKVVDESGRPRVVYTGTSTYDWNGGTNPGIEEFRPGDFGVFFVSDPARASSYSLVRSGPDYEGANVVPAYLSIKNPLIVDAKGAFWTKIKHPKLRGTASTDGLADYAKTHGYDGLIVKNVVDRSGAEALEGQTLPPSDVFVAFSPNQIKSATGNLGTFDPEDPRITHSETEEHGDKLGHEYRGNQYTGTFRPLDPSVSEWIDKHVAKEVRRTFKDGRDAIRDAVEARLSGRISPAQAARSISQYIGLNGVQVKAAEKFAAMLEDRGEKPMIIAREASKYADELLTARAKTIAATELKRAESAAKMLAWSQMAEDGTLPPGAMQRWDVTSAAEAECEICAHLDGQVRGFNKPFEAFGVEYSAPPDPHPNCMCRLQLVVEAVANGSSDDEVEDVEIDDSGEAHGEGPGHPFRGNQYVTVWHGSPHEFDEFGDSDSTIGTGEGVQAYGHGLYLAADKDVANFYGKHLSEWRIALDGKAINADKMSSDDVAKMFPNLPEAEAKSLHSIARLVSSNPQNEGIHGIREGIDRGLRFYGRALELDTKSGSPRLAKTQRRIAEINSRKALLDKLGDRISESKSHLYEVEIPQHVIEGMMDWDAPISSQGESIRSMVKHAKSTLGVLDADGTIRHYDESTIGSMTGSGLHDAISRDIGQKATADLFRTAGITGIKYLDGKSRKFGAGTRNYVLFDPKNAKIRSRNGQPIHVETHGEGPGHPFRGNQYTTGSSGQFDVQNDVHGYSDGQLNGRITARENGSLVGTLDYSVFGDKPMIHMVRSYVQRTGVGTRMVEDLAKEYGYENIEWGMMTGDGLALRNSLDQKFGVERFVQKFDVAKAAIGGKILSRQQSGPDSEDVYAEFDSVKNANEFAERIRPLANPAPASGEPNISIQEHQGMAWVSADIRTSESVVRKTEQHGEAAGHQFRGNQYVSGVSAAPGDPRRDTNFKAWFNGSTVVNPDGTPMVVYHGTKGEISEAKFRPGDGQYGHGVYFGGKKMANSYAMTEARNVEGGSPNVVPVYLAIKKPFEWNEATGRLGAFRAKIAAMDGFTTTDLNNSLKTGLDEHKYIGTTIQDIGPARFTSLLRSSGYDGIVVTHQYGKEWIAFDSSQVKSAVANVGSFDPADHRITHGEGPGHPFRGNQYTGGQSGGIEWPTDRFEQATLANGMHQKYSRMFKLQDRLQSLSPEEKTEYDDLKAWADKRDADSAEMIRADAAAMPIAEALIKAGAPEQVPQRFFVKHHNTGWIQSDAYKKYEAPGGLDWMKGDKFTEHVETVDVGGKQVEIRIERTPAKYVKLDSSGDIVRDADGTAVYMTDREVVDAGLSPHEITVGAFHGPTVAGYSGDEFGATGVYVGSDYQRAGLGTKLLKKFLQETGRLSRGTKIGQMTDRGVMATKALHKSLVMDAIAAGKAVPEAVLRDYPDLSTHHHGESEAGAYVEHEKIARFIDKNPSPAQMEAGNYRKAHFRWNGLEIAIETPAGGTRRAKDGSWKVENMPAHYGYIKRTEGADGDQVDIYMGKATHSDRVFIVDQQNHETGEFDEHKVMLGFETEADARDAYIRGFSDGKGPDRIKAITEMSLDEFKSWLESGDTTVQLDVDQHSELIFEILEGLVSEAHGEGPGHPFRGNQYTDGERSANFKKWFGDSKVVDASGNPLVVYHGSPGGLIYNNALVGNLHSAISSAFAHIGKSDKAPSMEEVNSNLDSWASTLAEFKRKNPGFENDLDVRVRVPFDKFDTSRSGSNTTSEDAKGGIFFSDDEKFARYFTATREYDTLTGQVKHKSTGAGHVFKSFLSMERPLDLRKGSMIDSKRAQVLAMRRLDEVKANYDGIINWVKGPDGKRKTEFIVFNPSQVKSADENVGAFGLNDDRMTHGEGPGHPFRGNQWTGGRGGQEDSGPPRMTDEEFDAADKAYSSSKAVLDYERASAEVIEAGRAADRAKAASDLAYSKVGGFRQGPEYDAAKAAGSAHYAAVQRFDTARREMDAAERALAIQQSSQGVDFWYEKMARDESLLDNQIDSIASDWAHIGGDGPIAVRLAAMKAFGLENGLAFDKHRNGPVDYEALSEEDRAKVTLHAAAMRHEYEQVQAEIDNGISMDAPPNETPTPADWVQQTDKGKAVLEEGYKEFKSSYLSDEAGIDARNLADLESAHEWASANPDVSQRIGPRPSLRSIASSTTGVEQAVGFLEELQYSSGHPSAKEGGSLYKLVEEAAPLRAREKDLDRRSSRAVKYLIQKSREGLTDDQLASATARVDGVMARINSQRSKVIDRAMALVDQAVSIDVGSIWKLRDKFVSGHDALTVAHDDKLRQIRKLREWQDSTLREYIKADPSGNVDQKMREMYAGSNQFWEVATSHPEFESWRDAKKRADSTIKIGKSDWPVTLYRGVSADTVKYVPNYAESWSARSGKASTFGMSTMASKIDRDRVLVFQGSKFWKANTNSGFGMTEQEFILLSDKPKWKKKKGETHEDGSHQVERWSGDHEVHSGDGGGSGQAGRGDLGGSEGLGPWRTASRAGSAGVGEVGHRPNSSPVTSAPGLP